MPKHPVDPILRAFTAGESWPPEAESEYELRRDRALADTDEITDVHNMHRLLSLSEQRAAASEKDRADRAESILAEREREDRELWRNIKVGLVVTLGSTAALGVLTLLYEVSKQLAH